MQSHWYQTRTHYKDAFCFMTKTRYLPTHLSPYLFFFTSHTLTRVIHLFHFSLYYLSKCFSSMLVSHLYYFVLCSIYCFVSVLGPILSLRLLCGPYTSFLTKIQGADFGRLIANQILRTFIESYPDVDFTHIRDISQFSSFNNKLVEAISQSARSILQQRKSPSPSSYINN